MMIFENSKLSIYIPKCVSICSHKHVSQDHASHTFKVSQLHKQTHAWYFGVVCTSRGNVVMEYDDDG